MKDRLVGGIFRRQSSGKRDTSLFIKCKFKDEVKIQEEALKIFNLLKEFHNKYGHCFAETDYWASYKNMSALMGTFSDIAYSNAQEGVFENLSHNQFRCFMDPSRIHINKQTLKNEYQAIKWIELLKSEFDKIIDIIKKFESEHGRLIKLSYYFNGEVATISARFRNLAAAIQEALDIINRKSAENHYLLSVNTNTSLQITHEQMKLLDITRDEVLVMFQITGRIGGKVGHYVPQDGGYSGLSDEHKQQYNKMLHQFKKWQQALNIISACRFSFNANYGDSFDSFCQNLEKRIMNLTNAVVDKSDYIVKDYEYSQQELAKFKFPRECDISKAKLEGEKILPIVKKHC